MALPILDTPTDNGQIQEAVQEIATAIFKSAKISLDTAAKSVVPSIPKMVDEILEDLKTGSIRSFDKALDKLDRMVNKLGIDLGQYSKELAAFQNNREEKVKKSEQKIQELREKNIVASIEKSGEIKILTRTEIETKQKNLRLIQNNILKEEKQLEKDRKLLQESNKLKTNSAKKVKEDIENRSKYIADLKQKQQEEIEVLGERSKEQPGFIERAKGGVGNFVDEYVPTPIADVGRQLVEGLTAPITVVKDLASTFGGLLKPLKLLKPLFTGLLSGLKRFSLALMAATLKFLPFIAIGLLVGVVLYALYQGIKKVVDYVKGFFGDEEEDKQKGTGKYQSLDEGTYDAIDDQMGFNTPTNTDVVKDKEGRIRTSSNFDFQRNKFIGDENKDENKIVQGDENKIVPLDESKGTFDINNYKKGTTPMVKPDQLKQSSEMVASAGNITSVNASKNVISKTNNSLSSGISGVSNSDKWYNTATA